MITAMACCWPVSTETACWAISRAVRALGGSGRSKRRVTLMRSRGGPAPITIRLLLGMKPSRCGTTARTAAGEPMRTVGGEAAGSWSWSWCGGGGPGGGFFVMRPGSVGVVGRGQPAMAGCGTRAGRARGARWPLTRRAGWVMRARWLEGHAEQSVGQVAHQLAVRAGDGGRIGQRGVGPAVAHGQRTGGVEVVGQPFAHPGQHGL